MCPSRSLIGAFSYLRSTRHVERKLSSITSITSPWAGTSRQCAAVAGYVRMFLVFSFDYSCIKSEWLNSLIYLGHPADMERHAEYWQGKACREGAPV